MALTMQDLLGPAPAPQPVPTRKVVLVRAIAVAGKQVEVGTELEVDYRFASQLVSTGKAEYVAAAADAAAPAKPTEKAPAPPARQRAA